MANTRLLIQKKKIYTKEKKEKTALIMRQSGAK